MKKKLFFGLCLTALFVGCTQDIDESTLGVSNPDAPVAINVGGYIDQVTASRVNDDGFCTGDDIGVFVVNNIDGTSGTLLNDGNQADNVRFVLSEEEGKWISDYPIYYYDKVTPVDMIGYYPYNTNIDDVNNYTFEIKQDQSITEDNSLLGGYEASDFLWGMTKSVIPTTERVNIAFRHRMAGIQVELVEGDNWYENEWNSVDKHILVSNTIRKASIDLATGIVTPSGEVEFTDIIPAVNGNGWRAIVVPQSIEASVALFKITVNGTSYVFRKNENFEYISGKLHKFTIEVSKKDISGIECKLVSEDITPWESETISHNGTAREYVIIRVPESSTLRAAIEESGKNYERIVNLKIEGSLNEEDFSFMHEMVSLAYVNLENVTLPDNRLPSGAFSGRNLLRGVILPPSLVEIGDAAFAGTGIRSLYIPNSVKKIGGEAFAYSSLQSVNIPTSLEEIGDRVFAPNSYFNEWSNVKIDNFCLPNTLRKIGHSAFRRVSLNSNIVLPESLEEIGEWAFADCGLTGDLKIPNGIKVIKEAAFSFNNFTGNLVLPTSLMFVENAAFCSAGFVGELILPDGLVSVGSQAFESNNFSGVLHLPETLIGIGRSAFASNKFSGTLELPSGLTYVDIGSFTDNNFSQVILHPMIQEISGVMSSNFLKSVVCQSKRPPQISEYPFINSSMQGSTEQAIRLIEVQVLEESMYMYQTAALWGDYIPSVYRDFNLDLEQVSALNGKFSRRMIVRAPSDMEWSISHKPDWVTVTPSSGPGKVEVTITIDEMARGAGNRADSLVFKPTAHDHYQVVHINQYDYKYGNGDVITNQLATAGNGVNIVFMGDCFDAKDIAEGYYEEIMNEAIEHFFAVEPYKTYRNYFNVYTVVGHSPDSGMPTTYTINQESIFESKYAYDPKLGFAFEINKEKCLEYACLVPTVTKENLHQTPVVVIENSNEYGGVTYMWEDNSSLSVQCIMRNAYPFDFRGVIQHEVGGHAFGKLADEYIYHGAFIDKCQCKDGCKHAPDLKKYQDLGWYTNLSLNSNHHNVPWSHLIFDPQYSNYVEMYEGGYFHQYGVFRSEENSCMNNNVPYYSAISRQAIVERIMEYAGEVFTFEKFKEKDSAEMGAMPMSMTRSGVATKEESYNPMHNNPVIMGAKPVLNF